MDSIPNERISEVLFDALRGMAHLQARQEMLECVLRAVIVEAPPLYPLAWKALHTARSDYHQRLQSRHPEQPVDCDAAALALWNELCSACAPPSGGGSGKAG